MIKEPNAILMPLEPTDAMLRAIRAVIEMAYNPVNHAMMYKERHAYAALIKVVQDEHF